MRTWVEVNLDNLKHNLEKIKSYSGDKKIIGVIKANAYGMGAIEIGKELVRDGVELLAVACLEEALELKNAKVESEILIMGCISLEEMSKAISNGFHLTLNSMREVEFLDQQKLNPKIHIKIDTGMGRIGFRKEDALKAIEYIKVNKIGEIVGVYTHLSVADESEEEAYTLKQINEFKEFEEMNWIKYRHIFNSAGCLNYGDESKTNYARAGILLLGVVPFTSELQKDFKVVFELKTRILYLKETKTKEYISYGKTYCSEVGELIATIPAGYADGWDRRFSNGGKVRILGVECEVVGKVCMDMCMVKIPKSLKGKVEEGTEVVLLGRGILEKAKEIGTIPYELMTGIGKRVIKKYIRKERDILSN